MGETVRLLSGNEVMLSANVDSAAEAGQGWAGARLGTGFRSTRCLAWDTFLSEWRTSLQGGQRHTSTGKATGRTQPVFCPLAFLWQKQVTRPRSDSGEVCPTFRKAVAG